MTEGSAAAQWSSGAAYDRYMGRWSRLVARTFLAWLAIPPGSRWVELGCGSGALTAAILSGTAPGSVVAVDPSAEFIAYARTQLGDPRVTFAVGNATTIRSAPTPYDVAVSGLVLNFVPEVEVALRHLARAVRSGGTVAGYVWDYATGMEFLRHFWDAAQEVQPAAQELDEGRRFPLCQPGALEERCRAVGLVELQTRAIEIATVFADFHDYWAPFLSGQGPAPAYVTSLPAGEREQLRARLQERLPVGRDGAIALRARAWAVRGTVPR